MKHLLTFLILTLLLCDLNAQIYSNNFGMEAFVGFTIPTYKYSTGRSSNANASGIPEGGVLAGLKLTYHGDARIGVYFPIRYIAERTTIKGYREIFACTFCRGANGNFISQIMSTSMGNLHLRASYIEYGAGVTCNLFNRFRFRLGLVTAKTLNQSRRYKYIKTTTHVYDSITRDVHELAIPYQTEGEYEDEGDLRRYWNADIGLDYKLTDKIRLGIIYNKNIVSFDGNLNRSRGVLLLNYEI
ncbi:MAG: hypothetical protein AAGF87_16095 [Bacteroidota bacterium]